MKFFSCFSVKHPLRLPVLFIAFFVIRLSANAQCDQDLYLYQSAGPGTLCSPETVTLTVEFNAYLTNGWVWGKMNWYTQETGGDPFQSQDIATNQIYISESVDVNATDGLTIWVAYYDNYTGCESSRVPYTFSITPTPAINGEYSYVCGNVAKIQMTSPTPGVSYYLYKSNQSGWYDNIASNTTGFFEIDDYDPSGVYALSASSGGCGTPMYILYFDSYITDPPTFTGNLSVYTGASTVITALDGNNAQNFTWYDANGNFIYDGYSYTTPPLTSNTTYQVKWHSDDLGGDNTCVSNPGYVTVHVSNPPQPPVCDLDIYIYQSSGPSVLCSPQTVTLTAEFDGTLNNGWIWGTLNWYTQETGGQPFHSQEFATNQTHISGSADVNANNGVTIWVSFLDHNTGCESPRIPYTFSVTPPPSLNGLYSHACGDVGKVQLSSNTPGAGYYLYKAIPGGGYNNIAWNTTGYFEISDYDPNSIYTIMASAGGCSTPMYQLWFDAFDPTAPSVTGNTTIPAGTTTTLSASGNEYFYKWYDGSGNYISDGYSYTTPVLKDNVYTYQVRAVTEDEVCIGYPATVTITVNLPTITYGSPYNSGNFTKTIDVSKPVGAVNGMAGTTPAGGATYSIPIYTPPGTNGLVPSVSVAYNSQAGNGLVGYGWNISGLSIITRNGKDIFHDGAVTPVSYSDQDVFMLNGNRLNPVTGANGANGTVYAGEEETFSKIISNGGSSSNPDWFQVIAKDGTVLEFGNSADSRQMTDDGANVIMWRLNKVTDINGNYMVFKYDNGYRDSRIDEIDYTGNANTGLLPYNVIKFNYDVRTDVATAYMAGASLTSKHILNSVTVSSDGNLVKTYQFNYGFDNLYSLLKEVTETGSDGTSLNSTIFLYGDAPANLTIESSSVVAGSAVDIYTGDYNGDGISDIMAANYAYTNSSFKYNTGYTIYSRTSQNSDFQPVYTVPLDNTFQVVFSKQVPSGRTIFTSDFDGDGRDDILLTQTHIQNGNDGTRRVDGIQINYSKDANYSTGGFPLPQTFDLNGYGICSLFGSAGNYIIPGDFDGDGATDLVIILSNDIGAYHAFYTSPRAGIINQEIAINGLSPAQVFNANNILPVDFNGDGKMELLATIGSYTYMLSLSPNTGDIWNPYKMDIIYKTFGINSNCKIYPGDFNGDRKTDFLMKAPNGWSIMYSDGKAMFSKDFSFNEYIDLTNDKLIIADFNGDGKSDILHGYDYFVGGVASTSKLSTYYSKGDPSTGFLYEQTDYNKVLGFTPLVVADLNGDGRNDFISTNYYADPFDILYLKQNGKERILSKVTTGHNVTTSFGYKTLTDKTSTPYVHNRTVSLDNAPNPYPINYVQQPLYVLSSVTGPDGAGGSNTVTYSYENAMVHRAGKGFIGFEKTIAQDAAKGITSITQNQVNTDFAVVYPVTQSTQLTTTGEVLSQSTISTSFVSLSTGATDPKRFVQHTDDVVSVNNLTGAATENSNSYDNYGNITTNTVKTGALSGSTVTATETITTTTAFGTYNTPVPARPDNITVSKVRTGQPAQNGTTTYSYNTNGTLASETAWSGLPKAVTTSYTYNGFGNVTQTTIAANGLTTRVTGATYDSYGRYPITKQAGSGTTAQTESFTYDGKWGKPLSHTSTDCLTGTFEYDGFGNLKKTNLPEGYSITTSKNWDVQGNNVYYEYTNIPGGSPSTKVWFDKLGRQTQKQTAGFNNQWLTQATTYDARGNIATTTNQYYSSETPVTTTSTYDSYNRLQTASNVLNTITYTYTNLGGGKLQVATQDAAGQTASKIYDATGKVVSVIDKGGQIDFTYSSSGHQNQTTHGGVILITADYDNYGRQKTLIDKNSGTISYEYDAFGQLKQQTDNNGNTYNMTYDDLGRIINRQGPEGTTVYEYYRDLNTGCSNNKLAKVTGFNGVIKQYAFDNLKRVQSETETIDGTNYVTQYGYDAYSNVNKVTYPSGIEVNNVYDNNGQLYKVTAGDPGAQTTVFNGSQVNGYGQFTSYTLGNNRTAQATYVNGFPTHYYTQGIQDLNLTWDYTRRDLMSRQEILKGVTESFQYDDLNRLTQTMVNNQVQIKVGYDGSVGTVTMGNIMSKTDAGSYVYKNDKVHAVAYITDPNGTSVINKSTIGQVITYTPFLKAATINQSPYEIDLTYGPDYERVKSVMQTNNTITETRIYVGQYEKQTDNTGTKEIHYIKGPNGLCAIIVRQNGTNNIYVPYTDQLGSIVAVTDLSGNIVAEQNFDAWGRNRNPQNWTYNSVPAVPAWLYRGYTGHEHLPQVGLINMNGRLYDPVQGRMLGPDNYISDPFNTQAYNRYAYAMNNPLVYTDPSGDIIFTILFAIVNPALIPLGVAMDVASIVNVVANLDHIHSFGDGLKYYTAGAAAGAATFYFSPVVGFAAGAGLNIAADAMVKNPETGENYLSSKSDFGDFLKSGITGGLSALSGEEASLDYTEAAGTTASGSKSFFTSFLKNDFNKLIEDDAYKYWKYAYTGLKAVAGAYASGNYDGKKFGNILGNAFETFAGSYAGSIITDKLIPDYKGKGFPFITSKFLSSVLGNGISSFATSGYLPSLFPVYSDPTNNYRYNFGNLTGTAGDLFSGMTLYYRSLLPNP